MSAIDTAVAAVLAEHSQADTEEVRVIPSLGPSSRATLSAAAWYTRLAFADCLLSSLSRRSR